MLNIVLLTSGELGYQVLTNLAQGDHHIAAVFTNKKSTGIIQYCQEKDLQLFVGNPRKGRAEKFIQSIDCDVLLSINYLFIVEKDLIALPRKYAINIHGALLPKYRGRTPHVWAIINGEQKTGITAHLMDEEVDNGDIIQQIEIPIEEQDTGGTILEKFKTQYVPLVQNILYDIEHDEIKLQSQNKNQATYFGKRTPADGQINWEWSKERIKNWIRAQAAPYPGAFTYLNNSKLTIHKAIDDPLGFDYSDPNGLVLTCSADEIIVKTPNGALRLQELVFESEVNIKKGDLLV